ncbi:MAG TPA: tetratricopeptide repeat protein [Caldithrix abyssi]|uniref:Tetratricopeptide repeat protein n=1 Tax=Caldithrix abyssi TaxID=187145 RepID=A0A7V5RPT0_CALAY|nr:tetratricopeptide repeat protein [Caldithrix abyssi]
MKYFCRLSDMRYLILLSILVLRSPLSATPDGQPWTPPESEKLLEMLDDIYNLDFDHYRQKQERYLARHPQRPEGVFIEAIALWMRILTDIYNPKYDGIFANRLDELIDQLEEFEDDEKMAEVAAFYINAAVGFKAIMHVTRQQWFSAALEGRKAIGGIEKAIDGRWNNADAHFGSGLYLYYADIIPKKYPLLKALLLIYPDGDKARGLSDLAYTAENGLFARVVAAYMYSLILYTRENRVSEAYKIMSGLSMRYPQNPIFMMWQASMAIKLGHTGEALKIMKVYEKRIREKQPFYPGHKQRIVQFRYGQIYSRRHEYAKAIEHYKKALKPISGLLGERLERYEVYSRLQMGYVYERMKRDDLAREQFERVLQMGDYQQSRRWARQHLKKIEQRRKNGTDG